jgi:hypothetical protein
MTIMELILSIALPCILIVGVFFLRPLRAFLEKAVARTEVRSKLIEEYHENSMIFLKETDPLAHKESREVIVSIGNAMMDGTSLIRGVLFAARMQSSVDSNTEADIKSKMSSLPENTRHSLGRALGAALLVSSFQSHFFGRAYRSILMLVLRDNDREIKEPEQIVYRFGRANKLWNGSSTPIC